jgi:hypothetical protein
MADRPFVRVYHADMINDYPEVWDDDAALATWLRLLVAADGSWPASAELPRYAKARAIDSLTDPGLVIPIGTHRFRIKGLDAERSARADAARNAAAKRWQSDSNAGASRAPMPNRAEPSQTEPNQKENSPPPQVGRRANGTNPRAVGTNPRATGTSPRQELERQKRDPTHISEILRGTP